MTTLSTDNPSQAAGEVSNEVLRNRNPVPYYFLYKHPDAWKDFIEPDIPPAVGTAPKRYAHSGINWIIQTYVRLKRWGLDVRISKEPVPNAICVVHPDYLRELSAPWRSYLVVVRCDRGPTRTRDICVVQNPLVVDSLRDHYVPLWPQPGLTNRDPSRGTRLERVAFVGRIHNLSPPFQSEEFRNRLKDMGMEFVSMTDAWWDYTNVDAILAVRDLSVAALDTKPPSKLANAWIAGVPALLGEESAFQLLRRTELDYFEVQTPDEAIAALKQLRDNPRLYEAVVQNGFKRSIEVDEAAVCRRWDQVLSEIAVPDYQRWLRGPRSLSPWRFARYQGRKLNHSWARTKYLAKAGYLPGEQGLSLSYKAVTAWRTLRNEGPGAVWRKYKAHRAEQREQAQLSESKPS